MQLFQLQVYGSSLFVKFICSRIKKKAEAKGKNCHAKTLWSLYTGDEFFFLATEADSVRKEKKMRWRWREG